MIIYKLVLCSDPLWLIVLTHHINLPSRRIPRLSPPVRSSGTARPAASASTARSRRSVAASTRSMRPPTAARPRPDGASSLRDWYLRNAYRFIRDCAAPGPGRSAAQPGIDETRRNDLDFKIKAVCVRSHNGDDEQLAKRSYFEVPLKEVVYSLRNVITDGKCSSSDSCRLIKLRLRWNVDNSIIIFK